MGMKLYIAGPMAGIEQMNYPAFAKATAELRELGFDVLSPHEIDDRFPHRAHYNDPQEEWLWYMIQCIPMVFEVQMLVLLDGWFNSRGAQIERQIAECRNIPIYEYTSTRFRESLLIIQTLNAGKDQFEPRTGGLVQPLDL